MNRAEVGVAVSGTARLKIGQRIQLGLATDVLGLDPGPVHVGEEAGHPRAGAELAGVDQLDSLMNRLAVSADDQRMTTLSNTSLAQEKATPNIPIKYNI